MRLSKPILLASALFFPAFLGTALAAGVDLSNSNIVDLTHALDAKSVFWPTSPGRFERKVQHEGLTDKGFFYSSFSYCAPEHGGTHVDAPYHFDAYGETIDKVSLSNLVAPAVVIDVREKASADPDYRLSLRDLRAWERSHGTIGIGDIVLLRTGWSARWPDVKSYLGDDTPGDSSKLHFPSFGDDAARHLIQVHKVKALGIDTASIDYGQSKDFPVHRLLGGAGVVGIENLTNLDSVPERGAWVMALPMKIAGGSGGPVRAVAIVPK